MEVIPEAVELHPRKPGWRHATSSHMNDWNVDRYSFRENRISALKDQDWTIDRVSGKTEKWSKEKTGMKEKDFSFLQPSANFLEDPSEVTILRNRVGG